MSINQSINQPITEAITIIYTIHHIDWLGQIIFRSNSHCTLYYGIPPIVFINFAFQACIFKSDKMLSLDIIIISWQNCLSEN
jgi:hypothetical protein